MSDLDTIREQHVAVAPKPDKGGEPDVCLTCDEWWPCDTSVVLDALEAHERLRYERHANADICTLEMAVLEGHAKALAEALRLAWDYIGSFDAPDALSVREVMRHALAAYDKDHPEDDEDHVEPPSEELWSGLPRSRYDVDDPRRGAQPRD